MSLGLPTVGHRPLYNKFRKVDRPGADIGNAGGCNAGVAVVRRRRDSRPCVEKKLKPEDILEGRAWQEIDFLRRLNHPNITAYIDAFHDPNPTSPSASLYMEFCNMGSLKDRITRKRETDRLFEEETVWHILKSLINAIAYCQYGILNACRGTPAVRGWVPLVHRDIKPDNIFLHKSPISPQPRIVLGDFGLAKWQPDRGMIQPTSTYYGNALWTPPECPYFEKRSDVWSIGAIVQYVCHLGMNPNDEHGTLECRGVGRHYSLELDRIVYALMRSLPRDRPDIRSLTYMV